MRNPDHIVQYNTDPDQKIKKKLSTNRDEGTYTCEGIKISL